MCALFYAYGHICVTIVFAKWQVVGGGAILRVSQC